MRGLRPTGLALLLLLVSALPAPAQAEAGAPIGVRVIEDAAGDLVLQNPSGTPVPFESERMGYLDILAVDVQESPDVFAVTLWIGAFPAEPAAPLVDAAFHHVRFHHGDVGYDVGYQIMPGAGDTFAWLESDPGTGSYEELTRLDLDLDAAAGRLTAIVPRDRLGDSDGAPPFPGRGLAQFTAFSRGIGSAGLVAFQGARVGGVYGQDNAAAPDGFTLPIQLGVRQDGTARLSSERPYRASNGEEATFAFEVKATNLAADMALFTFAATDVPPGWHVEFPEPQLELGAGASLPVQVLAHVPFAHQHGRIAAFTMEMRSEIDPDSVGRVSLGLHYTDPAQPSGHHPTLYLHGHEPDQLSVALGVVSAGQGATATMNTRETDPNDDGADVAGRFSSTTYPEPTRFGFRWVVPLSPQLQMGLDVDLANVGSVSIPVSTNLPMPKARLGGSVIVGPPELGEPFSDLSAATVVMTIPDTPDVDVGAAAVHLFESQVVPDPGADYLAYDPDVNLFLLLEVSFDRPALITGPEAPVLQPGGSLTLPLLEYADRVPRRSVVDGPAAVVAPASGEARKESPGPGPAFTGLAVLGLAVALARRRHRLL